MSTTTIHRVYGYFYSDIPTPRGFDVEIRSGVGTWNGGIAHVNSRGLTGTWTRFENWDKFGYFCYRAVIEIAPIELPANKYWIGIRVVGHASGSAWVMTTSGSNSIGSPIGNGNSFFDNEILQFRWIPVDDIFGAPTDFSYGVVPEPGTMVALAGALGASVGRRQRLKTPRPASR